MNRIKNILNRYHWDRIGVWSAILAGCFAVLFLTATTLAAGCNRIRASLSGEQQQQPEATAPVSKPSFTLPVIPAALTGNAERAGYLVSHYWDNLDFTGASWLESPDRIEQAFVDYLDLLPHADAEAAGSSMRATLDKSRSVQPVWDWFAGMYDKYLYDANSPLRDEERYAAVLEHMINDANVEEIYKVRPAHQLAEINKNRRGTVAADFAYTLPDGTGGRLHGIKADYTLLFFSDPDCTDCKRTKAALQNPAVAALVADGKMRVLMLYPYEDTELWKAAQGTTPAGWITARDASPGLEVKTDLYAIRATPSLYLLDGEKRVLLKDADYTMVEAWLRHNAAMPAD